MARPRAFEPDDVLDKALEVFSHQGFTATSTQQLCDATDLSRSSFYNAFESKEILLMRTLERYAHLRQDDYRQTLDCDGTGREIIDGLISDMITLQFATADRESCFILRLAGELGMKHEAVGHLLRRSLRDSRTMLEELVRRGQRDGSITSPAPARDLAALIDATIAGMQALGRTALDDADSRRIHTTLMALL